MIWFSSDQHLGHTNIMKYCDRPFDSVEEMDEIIISNTVTCFMSGDTIYLLGDLSFNLELAENFLLKIKKIGVQMHYIRGNHDKNLKDAMLLEYCDSVSSLKDIHVKYKNEDYRITLCHYPMYSWKYSHYGAWMLFGHHHNRRKDENIFRGKMMNVGVDVNNFMPVSFDCVIDHMEMQKDNWDLVNLDKK